TLDSTLPRNERIARKAVRFALRTNPLLDNFHIQAIMGFGTNGVVLKAAIKSKSAAPSARSSYPVAIKIMYKSSSEIGRDVPPPTEVEILSFLSSKSNTVKHKNIIHLFDSFQDSHHHYIILELVNTDWLNATTSCDDSMTLQFFNPRLQRVETLPVSPGSADMWAYSIAVLSTLNPHQPLTEPSTTLPPLHQSKIIFKQLAKAVAHLHALNIAHGDLKEENVLISYPSLDVRICDFGHARVLSSSRSLSKYGTLEMSAPEILQRRFLLPSSSSERVDGKKADVFALGVLLFALLHGPSRLPGTIAKSVSSVSYLQALLQRREYPVEQDVDARYLRDEALMDLLKGMTMIDPSIKKRAQCTRKTRQGDRLIMHYTSSLFGSEKPYESSIGKRPMDVILGNGEVIPGWEEGVREMCVGEKRK
ncbi:hypothetical protein HDV05_000580, partial [Chytridiales sp. JEL 0842]